MNLSRKSLFFLFMSLSILLIHPSRSQAATFCVNEQADDGTGNAADCPDAACTGSAGTCSLRDAILKANLNSDEDTITFSSSLSSPLVVTPGSFFGLPKVLFPAKIQGPGAGVLTIAITDGSNRVFWFDAEGQPRSYTLSGLTITNQGPTNFADKIIQFRGNLTISDCVITGRGRGISSFGESLTINNSSIANNFTATGDDSTGAGLSFGSGILAGVLTINNSTFSGNKKLNTVAIDPDEGGGGIGIFDGSSQFTGTDINVTLTNVTISGNQTNENGGGIWIADDCVECSAAAGIIHATLTNVTIADNDADLNDDGQDGGGLYVSLSNSGASLTLNNTLIAGNRTGSAGTSPDCLISGLSINSNGSNLVEAPGSSCGGLQAGSDITGQDPLLAGLTLNAPGTTETHALQTGSPAIDAGDNADCPAADQRGIPRPQGGSCDIGAFEVVACGDGTTGPGEACEPSEGCCTSTCQFAAAGTACDDGDPATSDDQCSGSSTACAGTPGGNGNSGGGCSLSSSVNHASLFSVSAMLLLMAGLAIGVRRRLQ